MKRFKDMKVSWEKSVSKIKLESNYLTNSGSTLKSKLKALTLDDCTWFRTDRTLLHKSKHNFHVQNTSRESVKLGLPYPNLRIGEFITLSTLKLSAGKGNELS